MSSDGRAGRTSVLIELQPQHARLVAVLGEQMIMIFMKALCGHSLDDGDHGSELRLLRGALLAARLARADGMHHVASFSFRSRVQCMAQRTLRSCTAVSYGSLMPLFGLSTRDQPIFIMLVHFPTPFWLLPLVLAAAVAVVCNWFTRTLATSALPTDRCD